MRVDTVKADLSRVVAGYPVAALNARYEETGICYPFSGDEALLIRVRGYLEASWRRSLREQLAEAGA